MNRVLTIGTFDLFHVGHLELLRGCRHLADGGPVIVGVNADDFVGSYKADLPIVPQRHRFEVVTACRYVDEAFIHYGRDFAEADIIEHMPDIIAVGGDWEGRDYLGQLGVTQGWLDKRGIRVAYIPRTTGVASSKIRASLRD